MKNASVLVLAFLATFIAACAAEDGGDDDVGSCDTPQTFYPDADGDGYGDMAKGEEHCEAPAGFIAMGGDCNDTNAAIHPDGREICDAIDNDCDGMIDDADSSVDMTTTGTFYRDADNDGYGDAAMTKKACAKPVGYAASSNDCNDNMAAINPGAKEICDYIDNDCDNLIDIADPNIDPTSTKTFYRDQDHDNFGAGAAMVACNAPSGYVEAGGDCNDSDNASWPGATEICDGADNDCDGGVDGTVAQPNRCTALVGSYAGSYSHLTQEKLGSTVINEMSCTGTGSAALALNRKPGIQGTFTCVYSGGMTLFSQQQRVTISANVRLDGTVTGTVEHTYNTLDNLKRTYNVTGTQTATGLSLTGTGSWYPNPQSAVPWTVSYTFTASK
ncbi:MAG TPA: putative metal-binding motif-containing protein [Kofleriaceae bacterium]|nr:putative metal-binding motif-containing protein [Kofleriaceae bacterium]